MSKNVKVFSELVWENVSHIHAQTQTHTLVVENKGVEPLTPCVQGRCSGQLS